MCYIQGGTPEGGNRRCPGCTDRTPPRDSRPVTIPHELYFSKNSSVWQGMGVAFVKAKRDEVAQSLGRMYLITREQFIEVVRQENGRQPDDASLTVDLERTRAEGRTMIRGGWYGRVLYLGEEEGYQVFTFTGRWKDEDIVTSRPSKEYREIIAKGLRETYPGMGDAVIREYLERAGGMG